MGAMKQKKFEMLVTLMPVDRETALNEPHSKRDPPSCPPDLLYPAGYPPRRQPPPRLSWQKQVMTPKAPQTPHCLHPLGSAHSQLNREWPPSDQKQRRCPEWKRGG